MVLTLGVGAFLLLVSSSLLAADGTKANPFADLSKDHWAYDAVRRLVAEGLLEGYSDGSFDGRRVISRYDLAVLLAKMLARAEQLKEKGQDLPSEQEELLSRLYREFRSEMDLLGVRVEALEKRIQDTEEKTRFLAQRKSNIRIEGFYRVNQTHVLHPVNFEGYPFTYELNRFKDLDSEGLQRLEQEVFLRFVGTPVVKGLRFEGIEAFAEIKGRLSGNQENSLKYDFGAPDAGDATDGFATGVVDQRSVELNRAHLLVKSKLAMVRVFANEGSTDLDDPSVLLTTDRYEAYSGMEVSGKHKKLTYFGSVLKEVEAQTSDGLNPFDLNDLFRSEPDRFKDNFAMRTTYAPHLGSREGHPKEFILGLTYNSTIYDYNLPDAFNRVLAADATYARDYGSARFDSNLQVLLSEGSGAVHDAAARFDARYRRQSFLATVKAYAYGLNFAAHTAQDPFVDTDINYNFNRTPDYELGPDTRGERLFRSQIRYDFDPKRLSAIDNLTLTGLYELKWFEVDPDARRLQDEETASRVYFQAISDLTPKAHAEFKTELIKDLPRVVDGRLLAEEGQMINLFRLDYRLSNKLSLTGEFEFIDDYDAKDAEGKHFASQRSMGEINSQINPTLFLKGRAEQIVNSAEQRDGMPRVLRNGRDVDRLQLETVISLRDDVSLKGIWQHERVTNTAWELENGRTTRFMGELAVNFTRALKMRYVHGLQDENLDMSYMQGVDEAFLMNSFLELFYRPTETTELRLTYGDEYENPDDPDDDGPLNFFRRAKIVQLKAQTVF